MRFPDTVTITRPEGVNEYGDPDGSFSSFTQHEAIGFAFPDKILMPPTTDLKRGDRLTVGGRMYAVEEDPVIVRSPSRPVLLRAALVLMRF